MHVVVNSVCWAPPEWGLMLAAGSSDGTISVLSFVNDRWEAKKIPNAHTVRFRYETPK